MDHRPTVTQLETDHKYPAAMVFPATPANYDALQILYEDTKVPPIPMEPIDIAHGLLDKRKIVIVRLSTTSYEHARRNPRVTILQSKEDFADGYYVVPYDEHDNEITSLDYAKGDTDAK